MKIKPFKLERYFAQYEFSTRHLLSSSDCDGLSLEYVLSLAEPSERKLWDGLTLGYTESQGLPLLRESIAKQYKSITPDQVLVLSPGEGNFGFMNVLLEKGDHAICMAPMYQSLYQVAESIGCEITYWKPDERSWYYDPDDLRKLIKSSTKVLIVNFPHNPTGFLPSREVVDAIVDIARQHNLIIYSDEMYHQLVYDKDSQIPALCDLYENAVSLWGMAKSFGLAGLRLGWIATRNEKILAEVMAFKDYLTICNNAMSEVLSLIAINHKEELIGQNISKIKSNIEGFARFHSLHEDVFDFIRPGAGSTAFIKMKTKESALDYSERLVKEAGVMLVPSEMFDYGSRHARIGFGRRSMPEALTAWDDFIRRN
jgi:aspartate/methionine/tyrosine aminotransferase